jgi:hypothetical protein
MNHGKSQTWMYYGAQLAGQYDFDYVVKCDSDTILSLHDFFHFAYLNLPPTPHNSNLLLGWPLDKHHFSRTDKDEQHERHFWDNYNAVHNYAGGKLYMLSTDLAGAVADEARSMQGNCLYCTGHEDHDISTMAYHTMRPVKFLMLGTHQEFYKHPVKLWNNELYDHVFALEKARMEGREFEGQNYTTYVE